MIINPYSFGPSLDPDAQAFLTAAAITDPTISGAINTLVVQMKADNIWTKMKAIYPLVGGTDNTHKWNLKNPTDSDPAFRLTFNGGITHDANGITSNGVNGYAETYLNDIVDLASDNKSISMYIRNVLTIGSPMGLIDAFGQVSNRFYPEYTGNDYSTLGLSQSSRSIAGNQMGFFTMSKSAAGSFKYYRPGTSSITVSSADEPNFFCTYYLLASKNTLGAEFSEANLAFASIQEALSDSEEANFRAAIQTFETTLSRNV
jgi:hypothetical protein